MIGLSPLISWSLFGLLILGFIGWCVVMIAGEDDAYYEAEDRDWLHEDDE